MMIYNVPLKIYSRKDDPVAFDIHYRAFKKYGTVINPSNEPIEIIETEHYIVWVGLKNTKPQDLFYCGRCC